MWGYLQVRKKHFDPTFFHQYCSVGLSSGYILGRTLKLILLSVFYIGRIDTPFLATGVGWLFDNVPIDGYAIAFRRDILIHEAVRSVAASSAYP